MHYPQIPCEPFSVGVTCLDDAMKVEHVLANYDLFLHANKHRPDYANATDIQYCQKSAEGPEDWVSLDVEYEAEDWECGTAHTDVA